MYNILIAIAAGVAGFILFSFILGFGTFRPLYGLLPGVAAALGVYVLLARRIMNKVQAIMEQAQQHLQSAPPPSSPSSVREIHKTMDEAVEILKSALVYEKWQHLVREQVYGQIGQIYYMTKKFDQAHPYLEGSMTRNWVAQAMLAAHYYQKKELDKMAETFEAAVKSSPKEALLWNVYAWCKWKSGEKDKAIDILGRALEHVESDEQTKENKIALQNNKNMKMRGWNMMWYQFHLDTPPQSAPQPTAQQLQPKIQFRRR
jgi:tetratricopeptide (TPR) repeat protein